MKSIAIQIIVFFLIFQLLSYFKQIDMLSTDTSMAAKEFTLPTTMGSDISLTPTKKTIIYFFAPWCSICHASIGNLQAIYEKNQNIDVIAVALDYMETNEVDDFMSRHQLTFPVAYGNEAVKKAYQVLGYPSYYIVNEQNTVIAKSMGYSTEIGLYFRSL
ncbi:peroxiredoxin family protein [Thalassotalea sediminis]|uniref:peroxiredoxin family protein n=1 Tax=Thalassotalea sediminis TaxID=1759089 RepID=UPI002572C6F3|nr:TlpA disulfide reductase family protein [Thalassotalea sediminis]